MAPFKGPEEPSAEIEAFDLQGLEISKPDVDKITREMFSRILSASTIEEAFDSLSGKTSEDFVGHVFTFSDVNLTWYQPPDRDTPVPSATAKAVSIDGEVKNFWTSSAVCVAFLAKAKSLGILPVTWKVVETRTSSGRMALNFEPA